MIELSFHGAAGIVTGSKYLLKTDHSSVLIDCGFFQGPRELRQLNWERPKFDPGSVNAVILTHAHIDHIGYLPKLVKEGFGGTVYATAPTADLAMISLLDSAHIQEEDAEYRNKKKLTRHEVALPLYTSDDAKTALARFTQVPYDRWTDAGENIRFRYHVVGHILGAASLEIEVQDGGEKRTFFFSGDVGRYGNPLTNNPEPPVECDYLICESTYGDRLHAPEDPRATFTELIRKTISDKRILLIPAFAVGRTQQITYLINELIRHDLVPSIDIHIDSPMAISVTDVYCKHHSFHRIDLAEIGGSGCVIEGQNVTLHRKRKSSKLLNKLEGPAIILSASGMLTGGRIMHHLINRLPDPRTLVALVGYMARGTKGRDLADGAKELYIHKQLVPVRAEVVTLNGLSGHADYMELMHWLEPIGQAPRRVFVTHGEKDQSEAMARRLTEERGWDCYLPQLNETVTLT